MTALSNTKKSSNQFHRLNCALVFCVFLLLKPHFLVAQVDDSTKVAYAMKETIRIPIDTGSFSYFMYPSEGCGKKTNLSLVLVEAVRKTVIPAYEIYPNENNLLDSIGIEKSLGFMYDSIIIFDSYEQSDCPSIFLVLSDVAKPGNITQLDIEFIVQYNDTKKEINRILTGIVLLKIEYDEYKNIKGDRICFRLKANDPEVQKILKLTTSVAVGHECETFVDAIDSLKSENYFCSSQFVSFEYAQAATGIQMPVKKNPFRLPESIAENSKLVLKEILVPFEEENELQFMVMNNFFRNNEVNIDTLIIHPNLTLFSSISDNDGYTLFSEILKNEIVNGRIQLYKNICLSNVNSNKDILCDSISYIDARKLFFIYDTFPNKRIFDVSSTCNVFCDTIIFFEASISRYEILEFHTGEMVFPIAISIGYSKYTNSGDFIGYNTIGWILFSSDVLKLLDEHEAFNPGLFQQMTLLDYFRQNLYRGEILSEQPIDQQSWDIIREKFLK